MKDLTFIGGDLIAPVTLRTDLIEGSNTTLLETYNLNDRQRNDDNVETEIGKRLINFLKVAHAKQNFIDFAIDNGLTLISADANGDGKKELVTEGNPLKAVEVTEADVQDRLPGGGSTDLGGYQVKIKFDRKLKYINALDVYLLKDEDKIVKNSLNVNYEGLDLEKDTITCPFNFGSLGLNKWAWNRGAYPLVGEDINEADSALIVVQSDEGVTTYIAPIEDSSGGGDNNGGEDDGGDGNNGEGE